MAIVAFAISIQIFRSHIKNFLEAGKVNDGQNSVDRDILLNIICISKQLCCTYLL